MAHYPKFYWENREGTLALAGCGASEVPADCTFLWQSFCQRQSKEWESFATQSISPNFMIKQSAPSKKTPLPFSPSRILSSASSPNRVEWIEQIKQALQAIRASELDKVVLAKRVEMQCANPIDPFALFSALRKPGQTNFFLQPHPKTAFLGSSPERLYKREGRIIECDAMAGTRPLSYAKELLESEKDLREFRIVQERVVEAIRPLCRSEVEISPLSIVYTPTVSHLHAKIRAELKEGIDDRTLLDALHPTPAVGGWPKKNAADWLAVHEPFARGLYSAPIGYFSEAAAEFTVAIRSCLITDSKAYLYAGTGIVEGSDPDLEWEESEQKLLQWKSLFHG